MPFTCQVDGRQSSKECSYDIILGSDFMHAMKIDLLFSDEKIKWHGSDGDFDMAPVSK